MKHFYLAALVLVLGLSCADRPTRLCEHECDCEGCSDRKFDDCVRKRDDEYYKADRERCLPEFRDLESCEAATWYCDRDDWKTDCGPERRDLRDCLD